MKESFLHRVFFKLKYDRVKLFKTLYINFRLFDFKTALKFPVFIYGKNSFNISKFAKVCINGELSKGMIRIGQSDPFRSYGFMTVLDIRGNIEFRGKTSIRRGSRLFIGDHGTLVLDKNSFISDNTSLACFKSVSIGENTRIGSDCIIMDTDFHFVENLATGEVRTHVSEVELGANNWIAGHNCVKKGTKTPEGLILAGPFSVINKDLRGMVPEYSLMAGSPAKLIKTGFKRIVDLTEERNLYNFFDSTDNTIFTKDSSHFV